ncbi:hypothetical protein [Flavobacterium sp. 9AF]|uniref:DUF6929 family protein n=1 Tax=Flavobacterium sp. 9AF TaxID=2653142 RepID=UPI00135ADCEB|nr:hypothetical protein [Flavobacterium sp. 9AF]
MEKFQLQLFFQIIGLGSASGLLYHNHLLYLISDNSTYLYEYKIESNELTKIALTENPAENISKKEKLDFESIALKGNKIVFLGSGSTENRNIAKSFHLKSKKIKTFDFIKHFENFRKITSLSNDELNIEGLIIIEDKILFFQRGNAINASNGIFIMNEITQNIIFKTVSLPKINNVEASFTDAILVDKTIYFLATVENTISTYDDGEILGTFVGEMNLENFNIENTILISKTNKFEGITLFKNTESEMEFLLCEDNDTEELKSNIYKLTINKK